MKRLHTLLLFLLMGSVMSAQAEEAAKGTGISADAPSWVQHIPTEDVIKWRRHIHQHPELSFGEVNTSKYVTKQLKKMPNIEVTRPTDTSVLGILKGARPGKTVAFRADMDAVPVHEETGLAFSSKVKNVSHVCGHDAHTAMLLGTAATLSKMKDQIAGTVYFLFQHAEEQAPGGAQEIIKSGALKGVDAFFGMHVLPNFPSGHIGILPDGVASTTSDEFYLTINGKGSHGSMPHMGLDPIVIGAEIVSALQTIVSRNVEPGEMAVLSVGKFHSGNAPNVIADKAELAATIRTTSKETRELIERRVKRIIDNIAKAHGVTYELEYRNNYPSIQNNAQLSALAKTSAATVLGDDHVFAAPVMTASEDFSYYNEVAPTSFLVLGVGEGVANHHPKFNLDESALQNGVKTQVQTILDYLKS